MPKRRLRSGDIARDQIYTEVLGVEHVLAICFAEMHARVVAKDHEWPWVESMDHAILELPERIYVRCVCRWKEVSDKRPESLTCAVIWNVGARAIQSLTIEMSYFPPRLLRRDR